MNPNGINLFILLQYLHPGNMNIAGSFKKIWRWMVRMIFRRFQVNFQKENGDPLFSTKPGELFTPDESMVVQMKCPFQITYLGN